jgi:tripartite-type tricarboxylate transporter receptor subunit TctC
MKLPHRRQFLHLIAGAAALPTLPRIARAQAYPSRPVRILVPFAAGGPTDVVARILADLLSARWAGQTVVIENRPGAGTIVATAVVAKAAADGYTVLIGTNALLINPAIGQKLPYDTLKELQGVSMVATQPVALVANKLFPANTLAELIALAKGSTQPINFTSSGPRTGTHLAGEMLKQCAGINMTHINYNGSAPALTDVIAGRVPIMFDIWHSAKRFVDTGELKLIASASEERLRDAPSVPAIAETFPGFSVMAFNAMYGPAGLPTQVLNKLAVDVRVVVGSQEFAERTRNLGIDARSNTPEELDAWGRAEIERWAEVARVANIKPD